MGAHFKMISTFTFVFLLLKRGVEILRLEILLLFISFHLVGPIIFLNSIKLLYFLVSSQFRLLLNIVIISFWLLVVVPLVIVSVGLRSSLVVAPLHVEFRFPL